MDDRMAEAIDGAFVILMCYSKEYQKSKNCKKGMLCISRALIHARMGNSVHFMFDTVSRLKFCGEHAPVVHFN